MADLVNISVPNAFATAVLVTPKMFFLEHLTGSAWLVPAGLCALGTLILFGSDLLLKRRPPKLKFLD